MLRCRWVNACALQVSHSNNSRSSALHMAFSLHTLAPFPSVSTFFVRPGRERVLDGGDHVHEVGPHTHRRLRYVGNAGDASTSSAFNWVRCLRRAHCSRHGECGAIQSIVTGLRGDLILYCMIARRASCASSARRQPAERQLRRLLGLGREQAVRCAPGAAARVRVPTGSARHRNGHACAPQCQRDCAGSEQHCRVVCEQAPHNESGSHERASQTCHVFAQARAAGRDRCEHGTCAAARRP